MSVQTLYTAATGMSAMEDKLDVIANNLANVNTTGFKSGRANFEDSFYNYEVLPGAQDSAGQRTPVGIYKGLGVRLESVQTDFKQGAIQTTSSPYDVAIQGNGFLQVTDPSGVTLYTRAGNFSVNAQGQLVASSAGIGRVLDPPITIPADTTGVIISPEGIVSIRQAGSNTLSQAGQIQLAQFINPEGLEKLGENLYAETDASGTATPANPGSQGLGTLRQNALEASNVEPVKELIDLITTQRSFELNSEAVKAGDQMLQLISSLRRF